MHPNSLKNLELGRQQTKSGKKNLTLTQESLDWLAKQKDGGVYKNASDAVDQLIAKEQGFKLATAAKVQRFLRRYGEVTWNLSSEEGYESVNIYFRNQEKTADIVVYMGREKITSLVKIGPFDPMDNGDLYQFSSIYDFEDHVKTVLA